MQCETGEEANRSESGRETDLDRAGHEPKTIETWSDLSALILTKLNHYSDHIRYNILVWLLIYYFCIVSICLLDTFGVLGGIEYGRCLHHLVVFELIARDIIGLSVVVNLHQEIKSIVLFRYKGLLILGKRSESQGTHRSRGMSLPSWARAPGCRQRACRAWDRIPSIYRSEVHN